MKIPTLAIIAAITYLIPLIAGMSRFKWLNRTMRVFLLLCLCSCLEVFSEYILSVKKINNLFLINYYFLLDDLFLSVVYSLSIEERKTKWIILTLALLFACIWIVDKMYFAVPGQMNTEMGVTSRIFIIVASIVIVLALMKKTNTLLIDDPVFWVATGSVIYSTGVLLIIGLGNELIKIGSFYFYVAWHINWSLAIVANLMFTRSFYCRAKQQI